MARYQKAEKEVKRLQREAKALQEKHAEELRAQADQVRKEFPETEEGKNLLEACWASRLAEHKKSEAYQKEVALVAGPFLRFTFLLGALPWAQSQLLNLHFRNQDIDRLLGEAEAEVREAPGHTGSGVVAEKVFEEDPP
ncbi:UNVERIFIED_CONTAM: hypothetical protein Slati_1281000 [Sesamum latifolium]|uniref:Uncharacterized protein n=1 Tax=Sesamum latifolium TaxID=2727402 RepID=A0AAW2XIV7_9LAMI